MSRKIPSKLIDEFGTFYNRVMEQLARETTDYSELKALWQELHDLYLEKSAVFLQQWAELYGQSDIEENLKKIEADVVTVEVEDQQTGKVFRRNLPVKYIENANGVILSGETLAGKPSQIAFLSQFACEKLNDVTGRGADSPRDPDHLA